MVEQRPFKADVEGSSPSWVTFLSLDFTLKYLFCILQLYFYCRGLYRHILGGGMYTAESLAIFIFPIVINELSSKFQLGNGGSWCRFDSSFGKKYKVITIINIRLSNF